MNSFPVYFLRNDPESGSVGHWPQIEAQIEGYYDLDQPEEQDFRGVKATALLPKAPDLNGFMLHPHANLTDCLSHNKLSTAQGLIINQRTKDLFESKLILDVHTCYPMSIQGKNHEQHEYWFMHIIQNDALLDYDRSEFKDMDDPGELKKYSGWGEIREIHKNFGFIRPVNMFLKKEVDLFRLPHKSDIMISDKARQLILENGLSGFAFDSNKWKFFVLD